MGETIVGIKYAVIIGVELYQDTTISSVEHAESDAKDFAAALVKQGFEPSNQVVLTSARATKTIIESQLKRHLRRLADDDVLYFFYAGHGFSKNGENHITCHDSLVADLAGTSIALQTIFNLFKKSKCSRFAMFLDACESGMVMNADMRGIYSVLTRDELDEFFKGAEYNVCFAACKEDECSYPSNLLGHGVWTYHLLQAFLGNAPLAIEKNGIITAASLQNYLAREVPAWISKNRTDSAIQTPWFYGTLSREFVLADVEALVSERKRAKGQDRSIKRAILSRTIFGGRIKSLSGFKQGHRVPDRVNGATTRFLGQVAESELSGDVDRMLALLREQFKYIRKDVVSSVSGTSGSIVTPDFEYSVSVVLDSDDPSRVIWKRELSNIKDPEVVERPEMQKVFGSTFDSVELEFTEPLDVEALIDALEAAKISVQYDGACTECVFSLPNVPGTIRVTDSRFEISQPTSMSPKLLVASFQKAQVQLNAKAAMVLPG